MEEAFRKSLDLTPLDNSLPQVTPFAAQILCFPSVGDHDIVARHLRDAFQKTVKDIPWLAGSIIPLKTDGQQGRLRVAGPRKSVDELLLVKHAEHIDYASLKAQHFPISQIETMDLWPDPIQTERPTFQAQLNFVNGGLLLAIRMAHEVADGQGLLCICRVWAAYCDGRDGAAFLGPNVYDRSQLMMGQDARLSEFWFYQKLPERSYQQGRDSRDILGGLTEQAGTWLRYISTSALRLVSNLVTYGRFRASVPARCNNEEVQTVIIFVNSSRLQQLKQAVTSSHRTSASRDDRAWISSLDAISSLVWCCVTTSWKRTVSIDSDPNPSPLRRLLYQTILRTTQNISILAFFKDVRSSIQHPPLGTYYGNCVFTSSVWQPFDRVSSSIESVSHCAYKLREEIQAVNEETLMRLIGALRAEPDLRKVSPSAGPFPRSTLLINSWANINHYASKWGNLLGGRPDRVRIHPFPRTPYYVILPKLDTADGWHEDEAGLEITIHTEKRIIDSLKQDSLFNRFVTWRCT